MVRLARQVLVGDARAYVLLIIEQITTSGIYQPPACVDEMDIAMDEQNLAPTAASIAAEHNRHAPLLSLPPEIRSMNGSILILNQSLDV